MKKNINKYKNKPQIYLILYAVLLVVSLIVFPLLAQQSIVEVSYGTFTDMVESGKVKSVVIESNQITFLPSDSTDENTYITGIIDDPGLIDRLEVANIEYQSEIPSQTSPFVSLLLNWGVLILLFVVMSRLFMGSQKKMGGGSLFNLGKSNAKLYVAKESGKTFDDVAGQDEAKEALTELVDFLNHPERYKKIGAKMPKGLCS